ncbi:MAG: NADH-quinone oxidoreductase subunit C [Candidatus Zixiibacteriota bacterium]
MLEREAILKLVTDKFPGKVTAAELVPAQTAVAIEADVTAEFFKFAAESPELDMNYLSAITGIDRGDAIEIVYHVSSLEFRHMLTVKTKVERLGGRIDSIQQIIPAANWFEREIWELYGVDFTNHPDLRRFLLPDDWDQGNPMLRDWEGGDFIRMPEVQ